MQTDTISPTDTFLDDLATQIEQRVMQEFPKEEKPRPPLFVSREQGNHQERRALIISEAGLELCDVIVQYGRWVPNWFQLNRQPAPKHYWIRYAEALTGFIRS